MKLFLMFHIHSFLFEEIVGNANEDTEARNNSQSIRSKGSYFIFHSECVHALGWMFALVKAQIRTFE